MAARAGRRRRWKRAKIARGSGLAPHGASPIPARSPCAPAPLPPERSNRPADGATPSIASRLSSHERSWSDSEFPQPTVRVWAFAGNDGPHRIERSRSQQGLCMTQGTYPRFRAAACHAAPVFLDAARTVDKACDLIAEAAGHGAKLIVFPESFVPGFPIWAGLRGPILSHDFF